MGADLVETAKHFGRRIAFIHVRDVEGDKNDFTNGYLKALLRGTQNEY